MKESQLTHPSVINYSIMEVTEKIKETYQASETTDMSYLNEVDQTRQTDDQTHYEDYLKPLQELRQQNGPSISELFQKRKLHMKNRLESDQAEKEQKKQELSNRFKSGEKYSQNT